MSPCYAFFGPGVKSTGRETHEDPKDDFQFECRKRAPPYLGMNILLGERSEAMKTSFVLFGSMIHNTTLIINSHTSKYKTDNWKEET
jgi:hypothetical protein